MQRFAGEWRSGESEEMDAVYTGWSALCVVSRVTGAAGGTR